MALEREYATYTRNLESLKKHAGQFVLIHGDTVVGIYALYERALEEGYDRFKLEPFMVNLIESADSVLYLTRHVAPISPFTHPS